MASLLLTSGVGTRILYSILLGLDSIVYWAIDIIYSVFMVVCSTQLFSSSTFADFAQRIYAILGVVMLFVVAFQILTMIASPEKVSSGDTPASKIALNIVITLIILTLLPTAFKYLYRVQAIVLSENIIGNIIIGGENTANSGLTNEQQIQTAGKNIAVTMYNGFIAPTGFEGRSHEICDKTVQDALEIGKTPEFCAVYREFFDVTNKANLLDPKFGNVGEYNKKGVRIEIDDGVVTYRWGISAIVGGFVVYLLASFAIKMGVRVAKLAYYQLVAPIPVAMRIIPKKSETFDKWLSSLLKTYLDVFIRLVTVFFCVYLIGILPDAIQNLFGIATADSVSDMVNTAKVDSTNYEFTNLSIQSPNFTYDNENNNFTYFSDISNKTAAAVVMPAATSFFYQDAPRLLIIKVFTEIALLIGILIFMKQAPDLLSETFGFDKTSMKLGIGSSLGEMALFGKDQRLDLSKVSGENFKAMQARARKNRELKEKIKLENPDMTAAQRRQALQRLRKGKQSKLDEQLTRQRVDALKKENKAILDSLKASRDAAKGMVTGENSKITTKYGEGDNASELNYKQLETLLNSTTDQQELLKIRTAMSGLVDNKHLDKIIDRELKKTDENGQANGNITIRSRMEEVKDTLNSGALGGNHKAEKTTDINIDKVKKAAEQSNFQVEQKEREIHRQHGGAADWAKGYQDKPGNKKK